MHTLICGSLAFDTIMVFNDRFKNHILADKLHILNVAFLVPDMRREYGGCAGNIAYSLAMLGGSPRIMATVGDDFQPYRDRLQKLALDASYVRAVPDTFTAQAFITTDLDDNQITAFHPGAMNYSHENRASDAKDIGLAIVAPDGRDGMLQHAQQLREADIPFVFDPGQGLPMFNGDELKSFLQWATYVAVNDYEAQLLQDRTGETIESLAKHVKALIVTMGANGSAVYAEGQRFEIPPVKADRVIDPTGCGDAYRAGLLYGISQNMDWAITGRLASLLGSIKVAHRGAQNHRFTREECTQRFKEQFNIELA